MLELLGRAADVKYKSSDLDRLPLAKKIEFILDDVLALVEIKRKEVHIVIDE